MHACFLRLREVKGTGNIRGSPGSSLRKVLARSRPGARYVAKSLCQVSIVWTDEACLLAPHPQAWLREGIVEASEQHGSPEIVDQDSDHSIAVHHRYAEGPGGFPGRGTSFGAGANVGDTDGDLLRGEIDWTEPGKNGGGGGRKATSSHGGWWA